MMKTRKAARSKVAASPPWMRPLRFASTFENYNIKAIEHFFGVYIASSKHSGA